MYIYAAYIVAVFFRQYRINCSQLYTNNTPVVEETSDLSHMAMVHFAFCQQDISFHVENVEVNILIVCLWFKWCRHLEYPSFQEGVKHWLHRSVQELDKVENHLLYKLVISSEWTASL